MVGYPMLTPQAILDKLREKGGYPPKTAYLAEYPNTCGPNYTDKSTPYEEKKKGAGWLAKGFSFGLDFVPIVGNIKSAAEAIMGSDVITGEKLSTGERWLAAAGTFVPWVRKADTVVDVVKRADDVIDGIGSARKADAASDLGLRELGSRGVRNTETLTDAQRAQIEKHVKELGLNPDDFLISSHMSSYSDMLDKVFIGPNAFKANARTSSSVFESMTPRAVVAHEAGHMITTRNGTAFEAGSLYDEVAASLTGRNLPGLNNVERYQLLRDAVERARIEGKDLRKVLSEMEAR